MKAGKKLNAKKVIIIVASVLFVLVTMLCFVLLTAIQKVEVRFAVAGNMDTEAVQTVVDKNIGQNLFLLDESKVEDSLSEFSYVEVISVEKRFPNVLEISVKERREVYGVEVDNSVLVLDEDGRLLTTKSKSSFNWTREIIKLDLGGVSITEKIPGQVIKTDSDELFNSVFEMSKSVNLNNSIKEISVIKYDAPGELSDVEFVTYTGVKICVYKAEEKGVEKITVAFNIYDTQVSDYEKATSTIYVWYNAEKDDIDKVWSDRSADGQ